METSEKTKKEQRQTSKEKNLSTLHDLFIHELEELFDAEKQMLKTMHAYKKAVTSHELDELLEDHIDISEIQVKRIEEIFHQFNMPPLSSHNDAIEGLIKEGNELVDSITDLMVKDAAIIASIQKIKHYEIACYGCLRTFAMVLGYDEASDLLQATLDEESMTDRKLTEIAEAFVNEEANHM